MKNPELLPAWALGYKDKLIHFRMATARTNMLKVARVLRECKPKDSLWMSRAAVIDGAAGLMQAWIDELRRQAKEDREKGEKV